MNERLALASLPTPLEPMDQLAARLDMTPGSLWVKRDDLTGLAGGGNKARKLEYMFADAIRQGANRIVTGAGVQSNHCRATAGVAARLQLPCTLVLAGPRPRERTGNLILDALFGAEIIWAGDLDEAELDLAIEEECRRKQAQGERPVLFPVGASVPLGCLGYVDAADEITTQLPDVELVVVPTGSCGTHAGLVAGLGSHDRVFGVQVSDFAELEQRIETLANETAELAGRPAPTGTTVLDQTQLGKGYAYPTESGLEAIKLVARTEGLLLEPVYTAKAMAGLVAARRNGRITSTTRTIFLFTGGFPILFSERFRDLWQTVN